MAIALSQDNYWALIQEGTTDEHVDLAADQLDITWIYPPQWERGYVRDIHLREGLVISIADYLSSQKTPMISGLHCE